MAYLNKETSLFQRDENGDLIPVKVNLETLPGEDKPDVKVTPLKKGEIQRLYSSLSNGETSKAQDDEIILKHCKEPSYTEEEVKFLKPQISGAIVNAILAISLGMDQLELANQTKEKAIEVQEAQIKKG